MKTPSNQIPKIALCGNPNSGKSSLFNLLTGQKQKVANYPGVTVDLKYGNLNYSDQEIQLIDLPGTYSFYPSSKDELVVSRVLANPNDDNYPHGIVYTIDATKLDKQMLLLTQIMTLKIPCLLVLNMFDLIQDQDIDIASIAKKMDLQIVKLSTKTGLGFDELKSKIGELYSNPQNFVSSNTFFFPSQKLKEMASLVKEKTGFQNEYQNILVAHHFEHYPFVAEIDKKAFSEQFEKNGFVSLDHQIKETLARYEEFEPLVKGATQVQSNYEEQSVKLDKIFTHPIFGVGIFLLLMLMLFQAIFAWATIPMEFIDSMFGSLGSWVSNNLPDTWWTSLLSDGLIAGLGGVLIFIPQIAILFFFLSLLEQSGYMARVVYLFDRFMQRFGMNGKSLVAMVSSTACAIPAVMSTRTIPNWKERIITIMVAPLMSCSARIPVYVILIALVVPTTKVLGVFNMQGLVFFGLYGLGILGALLSALAFKYILKSDERSFLMLELPDYKWPSMTNTLHVVKDKVFTFIWEAGRIILMISVLLWFLSSYGPSKQMAAAEQSSQIIISEQNLSASEGENLLAAKKLEASYAGKLGKFIEPVIEPLGFDWKIGIALITSFAAREVFVGTMATIYSVGSADNDFAIQKKMAAEINPATGQKTFTFAVAMSLLVFYVFAMQCMSTLAVVKKETKSWKWPLIQFTFMTLMAYFGSMLTYQLLS